MAEGSGFMNRRDVLRILAASGALGSVGFSGLLYSNQQEYLSGSPNDIADSSLSSFDDELLLVRRPTVFASGKLFQRTSNSSQRSSDLGQTLEGINTGEYNHHSLKHHLRDQGKNIMIHLRPSTLLDSPQEGIYVVANGNYANPTLALAGLFHAIHQTMVGDSELHVVDVIRKGGINAVYRSIDGSSNFVPFYSTENSLNEAIRTHSWCVPSDPAEYKTLAYYTEKNGGAFKIKRSNESDPFVRTSIFPPNIPANELDAPLLVLDPKNSNRLWFGGWDSGPVMKTTNGGADWTPVSELGVWVYLGIDPISSEIVVVDYIGRVHRGPMDGDLLYQTTIADLAAAAVTNPDRYHLNFTRKPGDTNGKTFYFGPADQSGKAVAGRSPRGANIFARLDAFKSVQANIPTDLNFSAGTAVAEIQYSLGVTPEVPISGITVMSNDANPNMSLAFYDNLASVLDMDVKNDSAFNINGQVVAISGLGQGAKLRFDVSDKPAEAPILAAYNRTTEQ